MNTTLINREFRIVFQPKTDVRTRFAVGAGSLHKYVTPENANKAFLRAWNSLDDKIQVKLRKYGRIDFYRK